MLGMYTVAGGGLISIFRLRVMVSNVVPNAIQSFHATFCIQYTFTVCFNVILWVVSHLTSFLVLEPLEL